MKTLKLLLKVNLIFILTVISFVAFNQKSAQAHTTHEVSFNGNTFSPATLNIETGDNVRFVNNSVVALDLSSDPHPTHTNYPLLNYGAININGGTGIVVFNEVGTFGYHNHENPNQKGTIVVTQSQHDITPTPTLAMTATPTPASATTEPTPTATPTLEPTGEVEVTPTVENRPIVLTTTTVPTTTTLTPTISPTPSITTSNLPKVDVMVTDSNGKAVSNATVVLSLNALKQTTDSTGKATFTSVKPGPEKVTVQFNGKSQEKNFTLNTSNTKISFVLAKESNKLLLPILSGVVMILIIAAATYALISYRKSRVQNKIVVGQEISNESPLVKHEEPLG